MWQRSNYCQVAIASFKTPAARRYDEASLTRIGRYDAKAFKFTPVLAVPELEFGNGAMWVDEAGREVLIALDEDVVVAPLPAENGKQ